MNLICLFKGHEIRSCSYTFRVYKTWYDLMFCLRCKRLEVVVAEDLKDVR